MRRIGAGAALPALLLAAACDSNVAPTATAPAKLGESAGAQVVPAQQAISGAKIATLDLEELTQTEIGRVIPGGEACTFRYTRAGKPVLATDGAAGVIKLNGHLIAMSARAGEAGGGAALIADGVEVTVTPLDEGGADGIRTVRTEFTLADDLHVGYQGAYVCGVDPSNNS